MDMREKILDCARKVLSMTKGGGLQYDIECFMEAYEECGDETDFRDLLAVFGRIVEEGFDITGFELYEVPHPSIYTFYNQEKRQMFDLCVNDLFQTGQNVCPSYLDGDNTNREASSIEEAVRKFNPDFC